MLELRWQRVCVCVCVCVCGVGVGTAQGASADKKQTVTCFTCLATLLVLPWRLFPFPVFFLYWFAIDYVVASPEDARQKELEDVSCTLLNFNVRLRRLPQVSFNVL